jgi:hypothetical protein
MVSVIYNGKPAASTIFTNFLSINGSRWYREMAVSIRGLQCSGKQRKLKKNCLLGDTPVENCLSGQKFVLLGITCCDVINFKYGTHDHAHVDFEWASRCIAY